jgi:carboxyl-terminal processing protease
VTLAIGAASALRDDGVQREPPRLGVDGYQEAFQAFLYLRNESINAVEAPALLQGGWDAGRTAARLDDATMAPADKGGGASAAIQANLTYLIENNRGNLSPSQIVDAFITGMAQAVDDPHTVFVSGSLLRQPEEDDDDATSGLFYGMSIENTDAGDRIWEILPGSPAALAGLKVGDIVLSSGLVVAGQDAHLPVRSHALSIKVKRGDRTFTFAVMPTVEALPTAETRSLGGGVDYLRIYSFSRRSAEFDAALDAAWDSLQGDRLVVDLRTNNGGSIRNVAALAGKLGYRGTMMLSLDRDGRRTPTAVGVASAAPYDARDIIFLVNAESYSGAEIIAAFGQQLGSRVVGGKTTGVSHAAITVGVGDGILELGIARNLIGPERTDIEGTGVTPDEAVTQDYDGLKAGNDTVIERAAELLRNSASR